MSFKTKLYDKAVLKTLNVYEKWFLPPNKNRKSLIDIKKDEFRDRKKLLNPYQK